jgi:general stress protein 26
MSSTKDLMGDDAIKKLRDLTNDASTCMFASGLGEIPFHVCPMQVQQVDHEGSLWFFSGADSVHNRQLEQDSRAQLTFCNPSKLEFLTIFGEAAISTDRHKIGELWNMLVEAWFPDGEDDPNLTLICVRPSMAHYWDTENGKLVTFAKILTAAVTGASLDAGVEGDIQVADIEDDEYLDDEA